MSRATTAAALILAALMVVANGRPARAAECEGVRLPETAQAGTANLVLNGLGIRKATFLKVHVYVGGLYLPAKSGNADAILQADEPWRLVLHFVRDVGAKDVRETYQEDFARIAGAGAATLKPRLDTLVSYFADFAKGQELGLTHEPGKGITVSLSGQTHPPIPGPDFATTLLKMAIGHESADSGLKAGLLGGTCS